MILRPHVFHVSLALVLFFFAAASSPVAMAQQPACTGVVPTTSTQFRTERIARAETPIVDLVAAPGDVDRLFLVEQRGRISILDLRSNAISSVPFLDIQSRVHCGDAGRCGEEGLLGLAFHPNYASNGFFYVFYTRDPSCAGSANETVVSRFSVSGNRNVANGGSERELLSVCRSQLFHQGGGLRFGPRDGYLYISMGDSGDHTLPQLGSSLLGKILRIDVDRGSPYGIPPDNPFVGDSGFRDEIWALGLRNPWRISFDSHTGDLYIGDVGQSTIEEIDFQPGTSRGGENYEWPKREGTHDFRNVNLSGGRATPPIYEYGRDDDGTFGISIIGGVVYRGCKAPLLHGTYVFSDWLFDWKFSFQVNDGRLVNLQDRSIELSTSVGGERLPVDQVNTFGTDARGEIYFVAKTHWIMSVTPVSAPPLEGYFLRGDVNADLVLDISDPVATLLFLFDVQVLDCQDSQDSDDDGAVNVSDAIYSLQALFLGGGPPPPPFTDCGVDPTPDDLTCQGGCF